MAKKWIVLLLVAVMAFIMFFAVAETIGPELMLPDVTLGHADQPDNGTLSPGLNPFDLQGIEDQYSSDKPQKEFESIVGSYWH